MRKYRDKANQCAIENDEEARTTFFDPTEIERFVRATEIEIPAPSEPTPCYMFGSNGDIASTYLVELQRNEEVPRPHTTESATIDTRAIRMIQRLIHARLLERARTHLDYLKRGVSTDDALYIIDFAIENGLRHQDIDPTMTESEYLRLKQRHIVAAARRTWSNIRLNPTLEKLIPLDSSLQKGDITLQEIHTDQSTYEQVKRLAHVHFAEQILQRMRDKCVSRELLIVLKTAVDVFGVNLTDLTISSEEYRSLLELYQLAS